VANTWRATASGVPYAANKDMLNVFNNAHTRVLRVYRMYLFNNQRTGVAGILNYVEIWRNTTATGGTLVDPVPHNPNNPTLNALVTCGFGQTVTNNVQLRRVLSQNDEQTVTTLDFDYFTTLVPFVELWNAGYADTNIQPLTCPSGQSIGYGIKSVTATVRSC
jgi:hypothetical protein